MENVTNFMTTNNYTFPVMWDDNLTVTHLFNVKGTPTNFIIDKNGIIQFRRTGIFDEAALTATLNKLK